MRDSEKHRYARWCENDVRPFLETVLKPVKIQDFDSDSSCIGRIKAA
jgi:hypothetical protein